jgi:branched-chain amino acid transport system substrate-binding protein
MYADGYTFWLESHNYTMYANGVPYKIKWFMYDDELKAETTAKLTQKLITDDKVDLIVGSYGTDEIMAQAAIAKRYKRILPQGGAAAMMINDKYPNTVFQVVGSGPSYNKSFMDFAKTLIPMPKNVAIIFIEDAAHIEIGEGAARFGEKLGFNIALKEYMPLAVKDLRPVIAKMKKMGNIDLVINTGADHNCISLVESASTLDFNPKLIHGGHLTLSPAVKKTLGKKCDYLFGITWWVPQMKYPSYNFKNGNTKFRNSSDFDEAFRARFGYPADYHVLLAYTILDIYAVALENVTDKNPFDEEIVQRQVSNVDFVNEYGPCKFDQVGRNIGKEMAVTQYQGKEDPQYKVVWPLKIRNAEPQYPAAAWKDR